MPKPVGRPKSDVETEMLAVRIPVDLGEQLNRYLDRLEVRTGIKANRASIARHALRLFLDAEEKAIERPVQQNQQLVLPSVQTLEGSPESERQQPRSMTAYHEEIFKLLEKYPEGLSPAAVKMHLQKDTDPADTMQKMVERGYLRRVRKGVYGITDAYK